MHILSNKQHNPEIKIHEQEELMYSGSRVKMNTDISKLHHSDKKIF